MPRFMLVSFLFLSTFFVIPNKSLSQNFISDTAGKETRLKNAIDLYHSFLSPETGLYDGSEYLYNTYYPAPITEGHPFFQSKIYDTGTVFYNNVLYEKVPLLYDIIKDELLTSDPSSIYILRLNSERISWFTIWGHTFVRLTERITNSEMQPGFYDLLYNGKTSLFRKVSKTLQENNATFQGINRYAVESNGYFIKKDNRYYKIQNKKSLIAVLSNKKKEVGQFIKKNKLNIKKDKANAFTKAVAYYDEITNNSGHN